MLAASEIFLSLTSFYTAPFWYDLSKLLAINIAINTLKFSSILV